MPLAHFNADDARLRGAGPFKARPAKDGDETWPFWYVTDDGRRNVLSFPGRGGAVLTDRATAEEIVRRSEKK